ncbi:hypothetical protein V1460_34735 [Streptomyces sp. SCSIO 30461]|uniref:hypothetical protein n=1 Tax=unclassified Streptomyces TaxID=2593676 RepID=UPI0030D0504A
MTFTISALLLFGVLLFLLIRSKSVGGVAAVVAVLFGYYLSHTPAAPAIDQFMAALANAIPDLDS